MKSRKLPYIILLNWIPLLTLPLRAQESFSLNFSTYALPTQALYAAHPEGFDKLSQTVFIQSGERYEEILLNILSESESYHYSGPNPIVLYHKADENYIPITTVDIPNGLHDGLMIVEYSPPSQGGINGYLIDCGDNRFPFGSACLLNRSEVPVIGLIGSNKLKLLPGASDIAKPDISERSMQAVKLAFFDASQENWKRLYSTAHRFRDDTRLLVLLQSTGSKHKPVTFNLIEFYQKEKSPTKDMQPDVGDLEESAESE